MKITIQFANDSNPEISEDIEFEIEETLYAQLEEMSKKRNVDIETLIIKILQHTLAENMPAK